MSLKLKVFLAMITACVALSLAVVEIIILELAAARALISDLEMPRRTSAVIHEMQIERGMSVGYVTSGRDPEVAGRLQAQRLKVDARIAEMDAYLETAETSARTVDIDLAIEKMRKDLAKIAEFRARVDAGTATVPDIVGYYTTDIDDMIAVIGHTVQHSKTEVTTSRLMPMLMLIVAKENGGLERALGAAMLNQAAANGAVDFGLFRRYWSRMAGETAAIKEYYSVASVEYAGWLDAALSDSVNGEVTAMRAILSDIVSTVETGGMTGAEYFALATRRLDLIKGVEDRIAADVEAAAAAGYEARMIEAAVLTGLGVIALLISVWLAVGALRGFTLGLRRITEDIDRLSRGDLSDGAPMGRASDVRHIRERLRHLRDSMRGVTDRAVAMARGDLSQRIVPLSEADEMGSALEKMRGSLVGIVRDVGDMVHVVSDGAQKLDALAGSANKDAQSQAAAAEELSATVRLVADTMSATAQNARETEEIANGASEDAGTSGKVVNEAVDAMTTINEKLSIVQEIARQTDLLALNAAVEAARAGEHGKGFAIVAAEVRKLAERSSKAAEEIGEVAESTSALSADAGKRLDALVPKIQRTAELVRDIAGEMQKQDDSVAETDAALADLSASVNRNAAHASDTQLTSNRLSTAADRLEEVFRVFHIGDARVPAEEDATAPADDLAELPRAA